MLEKFSRLDRDRDCAKFESSCRFRGSNMNPKKKSRRCRASVSIQALDLAISRFIHSPVGHSLQPAKPAVCLRSHWACLHLLGGEGGPKSYDSSNSLEITIPLLRCQGLTLSLPTSNYYMSPLSLSTRNLPPPSPANSCVFYIILPSEVKFYPQAGSPQNQFCRCWDRVFRISADTESISFL